MKGGFLIGLSSLPHARVFFIELKRKGGRLSKKQKRFKVYLEERQFKYVVAYSLEEAIEAFYLFFTEDPFSEL